MCCALERAWAWKGCVRYAVAMEPPQPAGTRRFLQIYAGQLPTGTFPTRKPVWQLGYGHTELV